MGMAAQTPMRHELTDTGVCLPSGETRTALAAASPEESRANNPGATG